MSLEASPLGGQVGILGGSFNPIHNGHLLAAERLREALGLSRILFVPTAKSPHKDAKDLAPAMDRLMMAAVACASNPYFEVSDVEIRRGGKSYSVDTVAELRRQYGEGLCLIIGSDMVLELSSWKDADKLAKSCRIIVVGRPGYDVNKMLRYQLVGPQAEGRSQRIYESLEVVEVEGFDVSSTEIRRLLREGHSIRYLVPEGVETMIRSKGLYGTALSALQGSTETSDSTGLSAMDPSRPGAEIPEVRRFLDPPSKGR